METIKTILTWIGYLLNPLNLFWITECVEADLNAAAKCYRELSPNDREAAIVWYLWKLAQTNGYSSDINDLLHDAACFAVETPEMLQSMEVVIAANAANAAGAGLSLTLAELVAGYKCLKYVDPQKIQAIKVLLECKMAAAVS